jgi:hypothetical protein
MKQVPHKIKDFHQNEYRLENSQLLPKGYVINTYNGTNTVVITYVADASYYTVDYPASSKGTFPCLNFFYFACIGRWRCDYPFLLTLEDFVLYTYDIEKKRQHRYQLVPTSFVTSNEDSKRNSGYMKIILQLNHIISISNSSVKIIDYALLCGKAHFYLVLNLEVTTPTSTGLFNYLVSWSKSQLGSNFKPEISVLNSPNSLPLVPAQAYCSLKSEK